MKKVARDLMWEEVVGKMERFKILELRELTLKGKVLAFNAMILAKMCYVLGVVPMPIWIARRVKNAVLNLYGILNHQK